MIWCLHGGVGMVGDWDFFVEGEREGRRAVDLWEWLEGDGLSLEEVGVRLVEMSEAGDVLLGYSLGGRLAMHGLLAGEGHWGGAVLVSGHPGLGAGRDERLRCDEVWARKAREMDWGEFLAEWNGQEVFGRREVRGMADRMALEVRREAVARSFCEWSLGRQEDLRGVLGKVECPVMWMVGGEDEKFLNLGVEVTVTGDLVEGSYLEVVRGCGHRVPWEAREVFLEKVEIFLGSL